MTSYGPNERTLKGAAPGGSVTADDIEEIPGSVLMYDRYGRGVVVNGSAVAVRGLRDFNPHTNRWAAKDLFMQFLTCLVKRPAPTVYTTASVFFIVNFGLSLVVGTLLAVSGRVQPVALGDIEKDSASQVGYWLGTSLAAPAVRTGGTTLVNLADGAAQNHTILVNFRQGRGAQQYPATPAGGLALPSDTPLVQVVDGGQR